MSERRQHTANQQDVDTFQRNNFGRKRKVKNYANLGRMCNQPVAKLVKHWKKRLIA